MIELPVALFGIPLKGINNPILVSHLLFDLKISEGPSDLPKEFFEYFTEATGFNCNINVNIEGNLPFSTKYVYLSNLYFQKAIEKCNLPISSDEMNEVLQMIDDALFDSPLIRALRRALIMGKDILYRDGEDPVPVNIRKYKAKLLFYYPIPENYSYIDNSLIHLLGMLPVEFSESQDENLIKVENGLWYSIYSIPPPVRPDWKIIWDLNYSSVIELRGDD